jgi:hypothetical protein
MSDVKETGSISRENLASFRRSVEELSGTVKPGLAQNVVRGLGEIIIATETGEDEPDATHTAIASRNLLLYVVGEKDNRLNAAISQVEQAAREHFPSFDPNEPLKNLQKQPLNK